MTSQATKSGVATSDRLLEWHRAMVLSREIEEYCCRLSGHWYPSLGEEAVLVGAYSQLDEGDVAAPHYRGALIVPWLRGRSLDKVMACVHPSQTSPTRGRLYGGFVGALEHQVVPYVTMVLGPTIAIGCGWAMALQRHALDRVALCGFGDGTAGTGDFHETLNLAVVLNLPAVFLCHNNQFSISTAAESALAGDAVAGWATRYGMPGSTVDGNDVEAVAAAVGEAVTRARSGAGPSMIEALTYRRSGHFIADPAHYRDSQLTREWESRDPITRLERRMADAELLSEAQIQERRRDARDEVEQAAAVARAAPALTARDLWPREGE